MAADMYAGARPFICGNCVHAQDNLAMAAIRFLTTVARGVHHGLFRSEGVLREVCERIVLPNLRMTEELQEVFEGNFVEYIRRDTEGSDFDTRRRAATELVKHLTERFPQEVCTGTSEHASWPPDDHCT